MEYDFKSLSNYDFELLVCDLLSAQQGWQVESFRQGRDQGIDLRYTTDDCEEAVVQCKHYAQTPFSGLCAAMKQEHQKIQRLAPERYLLATSQPLSPAQKDELLSILTPFCKSTQDILGRNELNSLLRQYPQVERAHYKLWLTSSAVLEKVLHSEAYQRSAFMQEEIRNKLKIYVQSKTAYDKAFEMLERFNCCIISGIPGIGKTTLAEVLSIYYLDQGYQLIKVRSDIKEALTVYNPEQKQVFFYDDFLGSTGLDLKENKNEGKELRAFMGSIFRNTEKKFILTTREYVLNQASQNDEDFARADFDYKKCIISLEDYTRTDRARILYNHLFFYPVPREDIQDLLADGRVLKIVDHSNYSPRLVETVINLWDYEKDRQAGSFYRFFSNTLDHPHWLWEHAFCRKISPAARDLLLLLCPDQKPVPLEVLKRRYEAYHQHKAHIQNRPVSTADFNDALKETEGTFTKSNDLEISYHNPSVRDFVHGYIKKNDAEFKMLCETAVNFDFCAHLAGLDRDLCRIYSKEFTAALRRTVEGHGTYDILINQIITLGEMNRRLEMREIDHIIQGLLEPLLSEMEITEDYEIVPSDLSHLLIRLNVSEYDSDLKDWLGLVCLECALAWFDEMPKMSEILDHGLWDFYLFTILHNVYSFPVNRDNLQTVYNALEDFRDEFAWDYICSINSMSDCEYLWEEIDELAKFFSIDMSNTLSQIEQRISELETLEEYNDEEWAKDTTAADGPNDREVLNMFWSLLDQ